jgi:hypothetical protein
MSRLLILEKHKELFKDDEAVRKFVQLLREATQSNEMPFVAFEEDLVVALLSTSEAQTRLRERIAARLLQDPRSIDVLKERLLNDELVDATGTPVTPAAAPAPAPKRPAGSGRRASGQKRRS